MEAGQAWRGPVARVPVTVCKPLEAEEQDTGGSGNGCAASFLHVLCFAHTSPRIKFGGHMKNVSWGG